MAIDVAFLAVVAGFGWAGYKLGLFRQAWFLVVIIATLVLLDPVSSIILGIIGSDELAPAMVLLVKAVVACALIGVSIVARHLVWQSLAQQNVELSESKSMGALYGAAHGVLVSSVILWIVTFFLLKLVEGDEMSAQKMLQDSKVAMATDRYNPLNLILLMKINPYLPNDVTGNSKPHQRAPSPIAKNENFQNLLSDTAFVEAYRERNYVSIIRNRSFQRFAQDRALIDNIDKVAQEPEADGFDWKNSAR